MATPTSTVEEPTVVAARYVGIGHCLVVLDIHHLLHPIRFLLLPGRQEVLRYVFLDALQIGPRFLTILHRFRVIVLERLC